MGRGGGGTRRKGSRGTAANERAAVLERQARERLAYLEAAFSFFLAFFSFTESLGLLVVFVFSWPLGIVKNSLRKPKWRAKP